MRRKKALLTTIGTAVHDIFFYTDEYRLIKDDADPTCCEMLAFEKAAKISSDDVYFTFGGGAANTAATFESLGLHTEVLCALGDDSTGDACVQNFIDRGIGTRLIRRLTDCKTGTSFIVTTMKRNDHVLFVYRGSANSLKLTPQDCRKIKTPWIYMTALSGFWRQNVKNIFEHAARKNIRVVWNPGSEQIRSGLSQLKKYLRSVEILILNHDEAMELAQSAKHPPQSLSPRSLVKFLHEAGAHHVIITAGHKGAYLYDGIKVYYQKATKGPVKNKTGAGDAFGSGLVAGLILYKDISRALKLASVNAYSVVSEIGAQNGILTKQQLHKNKI